MMGPFDPKNQTFVIAGPDGVANITISMTTIDAQRQRLANICISWGVQLGLSLMTLIFLLFLTPPKNLRNPITQVYFASLTIAVIRLTLLLQYFPGPLAEYYVAWTRDPRALSQSDFLTNTMANSFNVVQFAFIEAALIMQSWGVIKNWPRLWQWLLKSTSIVLALATIAIKSLWVVHHTRAVKERTLPVQLDDVGEAAVILGAVSIFYFCGIFFINLSMHVINTRDLLQRTTRGLTSLEILAIGNGTLIILPSIFAALDLAAGLSGTRVLPFDAGSWVQTLIVIGLPLIGLIAKYRGPTRGQSRRTSYLSNKPMRFSKATEASLRSPIGASMESAMIADEDSQIDRLSYHFRGEYDLEENIVAPRTVPLTFSGTGLPGRAL